MIMVVMVMVMMMVVLMMVMMVMTLGHKLGAGSDGAGYWATRW